MTKNKIKHPMTIGVTDEVTYFLPGGDVESLPCLRSCVFFSLQALHYIWEQNSRYGVVGLR